MSDKIMEILNDMVDEGHFEKIVGKAELMYNRKLWNVDVLTEGGFSYYYPTDEMKSRAPTLKDRHRVALTLTPTSTLRRKAILDGKEDMSLLKPLKFKIKDASGNIFSVASKTCGEAQAIVDSIYGKGHYKVSQMFV